VECVVLWNPPHSSPLFKTSWLPGFAAGEFIKILFGIPFPNRVLLFFFLLVAIGNSNIKPTLRNAAWEMRRYFLQSTVAGARRFYTSQGGKYVEKIGDLLTVVRDPVSAHNHNQKSVKQGDLTA
jgi:hypothetical protein